MYRGSKKVANTDVTDTISTYGTVGRIRCFPTMVLRSIVNTRGQ